MKFFQVQDRLTDEEVQRGLRYVIKDGLTTQAMVTLVGGAFLVDFALKLGASNFIIGIIAAIPPLAQLIQMPSIALVERFQNRRALTVLGVTISRAFLLLLALIPLFLAGPAGIHFMLLALLVNAVFGAIATCGWNSWMRDLIPQDRLGAFFARRMTLATGLGIVLSLGAGYFMDYWKKAFAVRELFGYSVLFVAGCAAGLLGAYFIGRIPEPRMEPARTRTRFLETIRMPLRDTNFRNLIMFLGSWNFAVNLALPFFTVYMLKTLGLPLSTVIALTVLNQLAYFAFLGIWGKYSDRFSNKTVLAVNGVLLLLCILAWTFVKFPAHPAWMIFVLGVIHVFMGIANSGVTLAAGNIGLKLAPRGSATTYLAAMTIVNSLAAGIAPILGGRFADFFARRELVWTLQWISPVRRISLHALDFKHWDFFFALAFIIGLYSLHRLALVKEVGEVKEDVIIRELLNELKAKSLRIFASAAMLRLVFQFPFALAKTLRKPLPAKPAAPERAGRARSPAKSAGEQEKT